MADDSYDASPQVDTEPELTDEEKLKDFQLSDPLVEKYVLKVQAVARGVYTRNNVEVAHGFVHRRLEARRNFHDYMEQHKPKNPPPSFVRKNGAVDMYKKWKELHPSVRSNQVWWVEEEDSWTQEYENVPGLREIENMTEVQRMYIMKLMFASADVENVGYLGRKQLLSMFDLLLIEVTDDELHNMFDDMDADGNNQIEWSEFVVGIARHLPEDAFEREVKVGGMGFRIWERDEVLGCGHNCLVIVSLGVGLTITVYFKFVLIPLFTAYFITFVLAPIMSLVEHRPIWCNHKPVCNQTYPDGTYMDSDRQALEDSESFADGCKACLYDIKDAGKFPHGVALLAGIGTLFGALVALALMVSAEVGALMDDDEFMAKIEEAVDDAYQSLNESGIEIIRSTREGYYQYELQEYIDLAITQFANFVTVLLILLFILIEKTEPTMFGEGNGVATRVETMVNFYIQLKVLISFATGALTAIILLILQLRLAVIFGILAFTLNFIPSVGSIMATLLPIPIVIVQPNPTWKKILCVVGPGTVQMVIGNVVEPVVFGSALNMTTLSILLGLIMWASLWGIMGAILSVPLLGIQQKVLDVVNHPWAKQWVMLVREDPSFDEDAEQAKRVYEKREGKTDVREEENLQENPLGGDDDTVDV